MTQSVLQTGSHIRPASEGLGCNSAEHAGSSAAVYHCGCLTGGVPVQVYKGPALIPDMKQELLRCLEADGFSCVEEAVGADHR